MLLRQAKTRIEAGLLIMADERNWATIGKIVAPFGLRGAVKVRSLSDVPDRFVSLESVYLGPEYTRHTIEVVRPHKGEIYILKFSGVNNADAAESLRNRAMYIPLDQLAELPTDSYYQHDIIGLSVISLSGRKLGVISDIIVTGSNDVYVIAAPSGKQLLIPAIKQIIKQVDLLRKVMYIDPIEGMIDDNAIVDDPNIRLEGEEEQTE